MRDGRPSQAPVGTAAILPVLDDTVAAESSWERFEARVFADWLMARNSLATPAPRGSIASIRAISAARVASSPELP